MFIRTGLIAASVLAAGLVAANVSLSDTAAEHSTATNYRVDTVHTSTIFRIKHKDAAWFYGAFGDTSGAVVFNESNLGASSFDITIKIASVSTRNDRRDGHLRSGDFFDAAKFPEATFKSTSWTRSGDAYEVAGNLTIRNITKPVTARVEKTGESGDLIGFEATLDIKRSDFGMTFMLDGLGDDVRIIAAIEAKK